MISDLPGFWRGFRVGAACGLLAGLLAMCGSARADSPQRSPQSDDGPAVAVATSPDGSAVTLHAGRGICRGEARAAIWRPAPGSSADYVPGCWIIVTIDGTPVVLVSFLDGERGTIPVGRLTKVKAS